MTSFVWLAIFGSQGWIERDFSLVNAEQLRSPYPRFPADDSSNSIELVELLMNKI
jgi:hypothetical protein